VGRAQVSSKRLSKRFYKLVTVDAAEGQWRILLDGMQLRTPGKLKLAVPSKTLAEKVAAEWDAQGEHINPSLMPVTRLVNVAVEQTPRRRGDLIAEVRRYAETDLLERQSEAWDKWLVWAAEQGLSLKTTESLQAVEQPNESLEAIESFAQGLEDLQLTLFVHLIAVYGSVVLAMTVMRGKLSSEAAFELSRVDADYQIELWGEDEEQAEITAALRDETIALGSVLSTL